jgi:hypothetical protein
MNNKKKTKKQQQQKKRSVAQEVECLLGMCVKP